jgi:hypothetical protein
VFISLPIPQEMKYWSSMKSYKVVREYERPYIIHQTILTNWKCCGNV